MYNSNLKNHLKHLYIAFSKHLISPKSKIQMNGKNQYLSPKTTSQGPKLIKLPLNFSLEDNLTIQTQSSSMLLYSLLTSNNFIAVDSSAVHKRIKSLNDNREELSSPNNL